MKLRPAIAWIFAVVLGVSMPASMAMAGKAAPGNSDANASSISGSPGNQGLGHGSDNGDAGNAGGNFGKNGHPGNGPPLTKD